MTFPMHHNRMVASWVYRVNTCTKGKELNLLDAERIFTALERSDQLDLAEVSSPAGHLGKEYLMPLLRIRPKFLKDVSSLDPSIIILGEKVSAPIGISPTSLQKLAHVEGECATAKAAEAMGVVYTLSTRATCTIEEIAAAAPNAVKWFQLYINKNQDIAKQLVQRAEKAGFKAIIVTVDVPTLGLRFSDTRNKIAWSEHLKSLNVDDGNYREFFDNVPKIGMHKVLEESANNTLTWTDIKWLQSLTKLPILLKGILTAEDALKAAEIGVAGVIVSNHGGRQLDSVPASIEALPEIVKAVGDKLEVYVDGGFREGTDVFKALALGAKMVFLGRPFVWGLTYDGERGVKKALEILLNEFQNVLSLTGCRSVSDITRDMVIHENYYSHL
ncbi:hypothetical protein FQA39_LY08113 [Lamprigera yunnana]|nr:hypothetical protein FQA39_LY08113 [Lamprigera yunnana]